MITVGNPPLGVDDLDDPVWQDYFYRLRDGVNLSRGFDGGGSVWPTIADIPSGRWVMWGNKATLQVRIYSNFGGLLKYVELT